MKITIAYAVPGRQVLMAHTVPEGATIQSAIESSGILEQLPHVSLEKNKVGVFGKVKPADTVLSPGDRVEIYFPVTVDPKSLPKRKAGGDKAAPAPEGGDKPAAPAAG